MEIIKLIERSNKMFELLEYTNVFTDYDELVSLKISLNNLLLSLDDGGNDFFQVMMLSSPVLFDFAFNSKLDKDGMALRARFERTRNYEEAKKWYKFVRNSLIHTNRYTYNNFLAAIYRIEYSDGAYIYFDLEPERVYRWIEFKQNRYFLENERANMNYDQYITYELDLNVRMRINYSNFRKFIFEILNQFIDCLEREIDTILKSEIVKWENYYRLYRDLIEDVYDYKQIDINSVKRLARQLRKLTDFNVEEAYVLCEFLVYIRDLEVKISSQMLEQIITLTTFDKYVQLADRAILFDQIRDIEKYHKKYIAYDLVAWILNEIHPLTTKVDEQLQILEHTNYLIMYAQKYLTSKGVI